MMVGFPIDMEKQVILLKRSKMLIAYLKEDMRFSSRRAKKLLKDSAITLNGKKAYGDSIIKNGDKLVINEAIKTDSILPENMNLSILYEDAYFIAIDKPPFILVYPRGKDEKGTLANGIRHYFDIKGIKEPVRFFNRLDMNTSGIVIIPKDSQTHSLLDRISASSMVKGYKAVINGALKSPEGVIGKSISKMANDEGKRYIDSNGLYAFTEYFLVENYPSASLIDVRIKTGRTHQIRVHLSSIGHFIIGDKLYGRASPYIERQALHANILEFKHPVTNKYITINSELPDDIISLLRIIKGEKNLEDL